MAVLYRAGQAVLSTFDLDEVLQRILAIAHDSFQLPKAAILLLDKETQQLSVRSQVGWDAGKDFDPLDIHQGITGASVTQKQLIYSPDVKQDPRYVCSAESTRSELAIPLMIREQVAGVLDFQSEEINAFDDETIELLTLFSTQAALALQNARLYSLERRRARQLQAINTIAQQSTAIMDLEDLLARACSVIQQAFQVSHVSLCLREEDELVMRAHYGTLSPCFPPSGRFAAIQQPWAEVIATSSTTVEKDLTASPDSFRLFKDSLSRMSIPLISFGQTHGVLCLHSSERNAFRESDLQSLESVADICASSIQNAHYVQRVKQLAYLDGLTGIFNRRYFELRIMEEFERARRHGTGFSVVMADIDDFKKLNDDFGHLLGDEVLRQASSLFHQQLRKIDVVCRYGGEEFAILLSQTNEQQAMAVAEKLRRMMAEWNFPGVPRAVTISAGVAVFPAHGKTRNDIMQSADSALYVAKQGGRNRVCLSNVSLASASTAR